MQAQYHKVFIPVGLTNLQCSWLSSIYLKAQRAIQKAGCAIGGHNGQQQLFQPVDLPGPGNQFLHQRFTHTLATSFGKDVHAHHVSLVPVFDALLAIKSDYADQAVIKSPQVKHVISRTETLAKHFFATRGRFYETSKIRHLTWHRRRYSCSPRIKRIDRCIRSDSPTAYTWSYYLRSME